MVVVWPGQTATITLGFSDTGQTVSQRFITATRADENGIPDDPGTVLTVSGAVEVTGPHPFPTLPGAAGLVMPLLLLAAALRPRAR